MKVKTQDKGGISVEQPSWIFAGDLVDLIGADVSTFLPAPSPLRGNLQDTMATMCWTQSTCESKECGRFPKSLDHNFGVALDLP